MAMEVLLMADVKDLGSEGEVVKVADGYARNYLFPKKIGAEVTEATKRRLAKMQEKREAERQTIIENARKQAEKLSGVSCTIPVKTDEDDKMYGSVTDRDIVEALASQGVEIDRNSLVLEDPIKELGVFDVKIQLEKEIEATIKVWVVEE